MNDFTPNRINAGLRTGGQFTHKAHGEQDIELEPVEETPAQVRIGNRLVDNKEVDRVVRNAIDDAIDDAVRTARNEGIKIFPACYDREQLEETLGEDLRSAIVEHGEDLSADWKGDVSAESALMINPHPRHDRVLDYLNEAYTDPGSHADDWATKHLKNTEQWVEDFIEAKYSSGLETEWQDLSNWNVEGVVEHVNNHLQELAEDGKLYLDEGTDQVLGNGEDLGDFYIAIMDKYYTAPDTDRWR